MEKYTEARLEETIIGLLQEQGYTYVQGEAVARASQEEVLLMADIESFLKKRYQVDQILDSEIAQLIRQFKSLSALDSYESNKKILKWMADGLLLKREQPDQKDIHVHFIDYEHPENNQLKIVNQLEIEGDSRRIPDGILYINGFPLVVLEFKSVIREEATLEQAHQQLCRRYRRDIPELMKYNAFSVISDGVNTKAGSIYASREFWYAWRRTDGLAREVDGIPALFTMIEGMLAPSRLLDIIHHFIFLPEPSSREEKIICRYPQYYATRKLYDNILAHRKPEGDGKGGTYFGTTGCGKSYTMLFLARLLMKSERMASPTLVIITDRTDLDEQLSGQFLKAKGYIGDDEILSVASRSDLREKLKGRQSGGVFLTTIHKFNEDTEVLSERNNVVCISDEAHRSQINLDQKVRITERGVKKSYGFARHLHDSLPHATYVGFTGTPVDATLDVFGAIVDSY
ncbi:MAG: type I restriction endonuclease, partial [Bacteroidota bacterium]